MVGELPEKLKNVAEMYAGCISGAIQREAYLNLIHENGFKNVTVQKQKPITIPDDILSNHLSAEEITAFKHSKTGIYSVTVYAIKPEAACCEPGSGCC